MSEGAFSHVVAQMILKGHYENTPIQIYSKFLLQKLKSLRQKTLIFFVVEKYGKIIFVDTPVT